MGVRARYELFLVRAENEAARLVAEPAAQHDVGRSVWVAEAETEIAAKAKPFINAEAIRINTKTTIEIKACPGIDTRGTSTAKWVLSDSNNSTHPRPISSNP